MVGEACEKACFWRRQFEPTVTQPQIVFDIVFGLIGPILGFALDPIVFRGRFFGSLLVDYQAFAYLFSGVQISLLGLWILSGPCWLPWNRLICGMLLCGACFCLIVGLAIAPLDENGVFGFTPFVTGLVYLRNSHRAFRNGNARAESWADAVIPASGILMIAGLPLLLGMGVQTTAGRAATEMVEGNSPDAIFAARRLMPLRFFASAELDSIVSAYEAASDEKRKELLRSCYREITGDSIEKRAEILRHDRAIRHMALDFPRPTIPYGFGSTLNRLLRIRTVKNAPGV